MRAILSRLVILNLIWKQPTRLKYFCELQKLISFSECNVLCFHSTVKIRNIYSQVRKMDCSFVDIERSKPGCCWDSIHANNFYSQIRIKIRDLILTNIGYVEKPRNFLWWRTMKLKTLKIIHVKCSILANTHFHGDSLTKSLSKHVGVGIQKRGQNSSIVWMIMIQIFLSLDRVYQIFENRL